MSIVKVSSVVLIVLCCVGMTHAQKRNELMGPEAKNYKPWKYEDSGDVLFARESVETLRSHEAKNARPWIQDDVAVQPVTEPRKSRNRLQGPKAKNFKPWED